MLLNFSPEALDNKPSVAHQTPLSLVLPTPSQTKFKKRNKKQSTSMGFENAAASPATKLTDLYSQTFVHYSCRRFGSVPVQDNYPEEDGRTNT